MTARDECTNCSQGEFSEASGSASCTTCASGYYQVKEGSTSCDACQPGKYSDDTGAKSCSFCPVATFASRNGSRACASCRATFENDHLTAEVGSSTCDICIDGFYMDKHGSCKEIPTGAYQVLILEFHVKLKFYFDPIGQFL